MTSITQTRCCRYVVSIVAVLTAAVLIRALQPLGFAGLSPLFAALIISAWYGGIGPGVLAILLSSLAAYLLLPHFSGREFGRDDFLRTLIFTITAMVAMAFHLVSSKAAEADQRARRAEAASDAKTRLLAMVSHDLRNPLSPIRMAVALAEQDPIVAERAGEHLKLIRDCVAMQARLIDDLMDVARLATGKFKISPVSVDLHAILARALLACEAAAREKRITIETRLDAGHACVVGDAFRLQQVFWNLVQNAIRFTPAGGNIGVRSFQTRGDWIGIEVQDNGAGIDPMKLPSIFKVFEQVSEESTRSGGLGLGLTICRGIIDAHDGTISASSAGVGRGASFVVRLPLAGNASAVAAISSLAGNLSPASP